MKNYKRKVSFGGTPIGLGVLGIGVLGLGMLGCGSEPETPYAQQTQGQEASEETGPAPVGMVSRTGTDDVTAKMGQAGGRLELSQGPRVVVPAGVVQEPRDFVLKTAPLTTAFGNQESEKPVGPTFVFSPGLESDGEPIEVSLPMPSMPDGWGEPALAYEYRVGNRVGAEDSVHTKWQYENAPYTGGRITAKVYALPGMRLQFVLTNLQVQ